MDREKVIKKLAVRIQSDSEEWNTIELPIEEANDILVLLKEQEAMTPEEFKEGLLKMFSSIWEYEIDHLMFQDTVGELMDGVMQLYKKAVK